MMRPFSAVSVILMAFCFSARAESDHAFTSLGFSQQQSHAQEEDLQPVSGKLVRLLMNNFSLREDFVKKSYASRVALALKEARAGQPGEIVKVVGALLGSLAPAGRAKLATSLAGMKPAGISEDDGDDLARWLTSLLGEGTKVQSGKRHVRADTGEAPRSVDDFTEELKGRDDIKDRLGCYRYCEGFQNWNLDDATCYEACRYRFPRN